MIYIENTRKSSKNSWDVSEFNFVSWYNGNMWKLFIFLYTNYHEKLKLKLNAIQNLSNTMKYLGVNITKDAQDLHAKIYIILMKENKFK